MNEFVFVVISILNMRVVFFYVIVVGSCYVWICVITIYIIAYIIKI